MSGHLVLFVSFGALLVCGLIALDDFHTQSTNNTSYPTIISDANSGAGAINALFTVVTCLSIAIAGFALLKSINVI